MNKQRASQPASARILKLPVELLDIIFILATQDSPRHLRNALSLTHICSHFRQIGLSCQSFWCRVPMHCDMNKGQDLITLLWLERSRDQSITLELTVKCHLAPTEIDLLLNHARRIRRLVIHFSTYQPPSSFFLAFIPLPNLCSLHWDVLRSDEYFSVIKGPDGPPLGLPQPTRDMTLNWNSWNCTNITSLQLHFVASRPTMSGLHAILKANHMTLKHFEYTGFAPLHDSSQVQPCDFPVLQTLLVGMINDIIPLLLSLILSAENLHALTLRNIVVSPAFHQLKDAYHDTGRFEVDLELDVAAMLKEVSRFPSVAKLRLFGISSPKDDVDVQNFFESFEGLRYLGLYGVGDAYFQTLFAKQHCHLFPKLKQLLVSNANGLMPFTQHRLDAGEPKLDKLVFPTSWASLLEPEDKATLALGARERCIIADFEGYTFTSLETVGRLGP
ncbi:hypothetical protein C8J56DRAFT_364157 [Mycena floridula]|nr:hypothetical protein C8J56DRAFT_364157 [Mycena floridula]